MPVDDVTKLYEQERAELAAGYGCRNHPAICSGDHSILSLSVTIRAKARILASVQTLADTLAAKPRCRPESLYILLDRRCV